MRFIIATLKYRKPFNKLSVGKHKGMKVQQKLLTYDTNWRLLFRRNKYMKV